MFINNLTQEDDLRICQPETPKKIPETLSPVNLPPEVDHGMRIKVEAVMDIGKPAAWLNRSVERKSAKPALLSRLPLSKLPG